MADRTVNIPFEEYEELLACKKVVGSKGRYVLEYRGVVDGRIRFGKYFVFTKAEFLDKVEEKANESYKILSGHQRVYDKMVAYRESNAEYKTSHERLLKQIDTLEGNIDCLKKDLGVEREANKKLNNEMESMSYFVLGLIIGFAFLVYVYLFC